MPIEIAVLAIATWPALRLLSIPPFRREYARLAWTLIALLAAYAGVVAWMAHRLPEILALPAAAAAAVLAVERWRARPAFGARRGLPPGSLGVFPRGPWVDDRFFARCVERFGPVFKYSLQHRPCICVLGAERGAELISEHGDALIAPPVRFNRFIPKGFLRYMAPDDHPHYKRLLGNALAPGGLAGLEPALREIAAAGVARLVRAGGGAGPHGVAPRPLAQEIVFEMLTVAFFGVRTGSAEFGWLRDRYAEIDLRKVSGRSGARDRESLAALESWVQRRGRALAGAADAPACFLRALAAVPDALDDETVLGNFVYALHVGCADLTSLLTWVLKLLGDTPEYAIRLRSAVRSGGSGEGTAVARRIVRETLRLEQSEYLYRIATRPIEFRGFRIPEGWRVRILIREGHRDPAHFPSPDRFDPDRWLRHDDGGPQFKPFGLGAHACIGVPITDLVSRVFLTELAGRADWKVVADGPREYGWAHWQPSSRLRIAFQPVGSTPEARIAGCETSSA